MGVHARGRFRDRDQLRRVARRARAARLGRGEVVRPREAVRRRLPRADRHRLVPAHVPSRPRARGVYQVRRTPLLRVKRHDEPFEGVGERRVRGRLALRLHGVPLRPHAAPEARRRQHARRALPQPRRLLALVHGRRHVPRVPLRVLSGRLPHPRLRRDHHAGSHEGAGDRPRGVGDVAVRQEVAHVHRQQPASLGHRRSPPLHARARGRDVPLRHPRASGISTIPISTRSNSRARRSATASARSRSIPMRAGSS